MRSSLLPHCVTFTVTYIPFSMLLNSQFRHLSQHVNAAVGLSPLQGPPCRAGNRTPGWGHARRETAAGRPGSLGGCVFWTPRGTEAPRERGLFCWKLVRIKSLPCGPLCPAGIDKHGWSRSETTPQGKKSRVLLEQQQKDLKETRTRDELTM